MRSNQKVSLTSSGRPERCYSVSRLTETTGKFVRQSGEPGRYAIVTLVLEPVVNSSHYGVEIECDLQASGLTDEQIDAIFYGVQKCVEEYRDTNCEHGILANCRIRVTDAKWHAVDSSEYAFRVATAIAIKDALVICGIDQDGNAFELPS